MQADDITALQPFNRAHKIGISQNQIVAFAGGEADRAAAARLRRQKQAGHQALRTAAMTRS